MPTIVTHGIVAVAASEMFPKYRSLKFWLLSMMCTALPDIDVLLLALGVPYDSLLGHRGISHSILFAFFVAVIVVMTGYRDIIQNSKQWWFLIVYFFLIVCLHDVLDAMTSGGLGVGFFMPFDDTRYFFAYRPIRVSPFSLIRLFSSEGKRILVSELFWVWVPSITVMIVSRFIRRKRKTVNSISNL